MVDAPTRKWTKSEERVIIERDLRQEKERLEVLYSAIAILEEAIRLKKPVDREQIRQMLKGKVINRERAFESALASGQSRDLFDVITEEATYALRSIEALEHRQAALKAA